MALPGGPPQLRQEGLGQEHMEIPIRQHQLEGLASVHHNAPVVATVTRLVLARMGLLTVPAAAVAVGSGHLGATLLALGKVPVRVSMGCLMA